MHPDRRTSPVVPKAPVPLSDDEVNDILTEVERLAILVVGEPPEEFDLGEVGPIYWDHYDDGTIQLSIVVTHCTAAPQSREEAKALLAEHLRAAARDIEEICDFGLPIVDRAECLLEVTVATEGGAA